MHQIKTGDGRLELSDGGKNRIWQTALRALAEGDIDEAVGQFAEQFTFTDHALGLEFKEKDQLHKYFAKAREMFPKSERTDQTIFNNRDVIISEWRLKDIESQPFLYGRFLEINIEAQGLSVVRVSDGRIVEWSEYYDQIGSRRYRLAGQFSDWREV
ncbi:MAG TPA: nuclear transport factor 2 family protein [Chthoniobacterales bacterium]|nr:nuclear transport factor 2 family protein [Chthoniobacterales bacterium]